MTAVVLVSSGSKKILSHLDAVIILQYTRCDYLKEKEYMSVVATFILVSLLCVFTSTFQKYVHSLLYATLLYFLLFGSFNKWKMRPQCTFCSGEKEVLFPVLFPIVYRTTSNLSNRFPFFPFKIRTLKAGLGA